MTPTVSVLIPVYNNPHTLRRAVQSALYQPGVDVEVVIVDDASTDDTYQIAQQMVEYAVQSEFQKRNVVTFTDGTAIDKINTVVAVRRETNGRIAATLNTAAEHAKGEYFIRVDSDDWLADNCLSVLVSVLEAHPSVGFVYGARQYYGRRSDRYVPQPFSRDAFNVHNASGYCYLFRREVWDKGIRWEPLGTFGGAVIDLEDWQHVLKMLAAGYEGLALPDVTVLHYVFRHGGTWGELKANEAEALAELKRRFPDVRAGGL